MKAKGKFISTLLIIDTFFVSFAFGFNSKHVLVIDPNLPPLVPLAQGKKLEPKPVSNAEDAKPGADSKHKKAEKGQKNSKALKGDKKDSSSAKKNHEKQKNPSP